MKQTIPKINVMNQKNPKIFNNRATKMKAQLQYLNSILSKHSRIENLYGIDIYSTPIYIVNLFKLNYNQFPIILHSFIW